MGFDKTLLAKIDLGNLPRHIAVIMDGNGRWAKKRFLPRIAGHRQGVKTVDRIVTASREIGIEVLTLYSFSAENWARPVAEVQALMNILDEYLKSELAKMMRENIRLKIIGRVEDLPEFVRPALADSLEKTAGNTGMTLVLALSYGSRDEILGAVRKIADEARMGRLDPAELDNELFSARLDTAGLPDPDLLIRTSGEIRISNFLLWQIAYTELYFTETLWPDFSESHLVDAIVDYQKRRRRFGKTDEQLDSAEKSEGGSGGR